MLAIKRGSRGAKMFGIQPEMFWAHSIADQVYAEFGIKECVLTEGTGGVHRAVVHYLGFAIDIRTKNIMPGRPQYKRVVLINEIKVEIQKRLGNEYRIIFEEKKVHFHIVFDPR